MIDAGRTYRHIVRNVLFFSMLFWAFVCLIGWFTIGEGRGFHFLKPGRLWFWTLLPVLTGIYLWIWKSKSTIFQKYSGRGISSMLSVRFDSFRSILQFGWLYGTLFFLILAFAEPVSGSRKVSGSKRILDLVICLDVSNSMNTCDMSGNVSRLKAAKNAIAQLLNQLKGERIAVIIFANEAFTQLPLTMDYGAAKLFVPDVETDMISDQGTNIGSAFDEALTQFKDEESGRAILVITDGEDHERQWQNTLPELKKKEVVMAFLGLGSENGGLIPQDPYDPKAGYKKQNGSPVRSQLDPATIRSMARATGAEAIVSSSAFPDMTSIAGLFSNAKNRKVKSLEFQVDKHYFQLAVLASIGFLLLYLFTPFIVNRNPA